MALVGRAQVLGGRRRKSKRYIARMNECDWGILEHSADDSVTTSVTTLYCGLKKLFIFHGIRRIEDTEREEI